MARYYTLASTRGKAIAKMMEQAKRDPGVQYTVYVAENTQPPIFLVGDFNVGMTQAGATPLMSFIYHSPTCFVPSWEEREEEVST